MARSVCRKAGSAICFQLLFDSIAEAGSVSLVFDNGLAPGLDEEIIEEFAKPAASLLLNAQQLGDAIT